MHEAVDVVMIFVWVFIFYLCGIFFFVGWQFMWWFLNRFDRKTILKVIKGDGTVITVQYLTKKEAIAFVKNAKRASKVVEGDKNEA